MIYAIMNKIISFTTKTNFSENRVFIELNETI